MDNSEKNEVYFLAELDGEMKTSVQEKKPQRCLVKTSRLHKNITLKKSIKIFFSQTLKNIVQNGFTKLTNLSLENID